MRKPSTRRPGQARIAQWLRRNIQLYWRCISSRSSLLLLAIEMKMMRSMILEPMEESKFLSLIAFVCALIGRSPNVPIPRKRRKKKAKLVLLPPLLPLLLLLLEIPRMRIEDDKRRTYVRIQYLVVDDTSGWTFFKRADFSNVPSHPILVLVLLYYTVLLHVPSWRRAVGVSLLKVSKWKKEEQVSRRRRRQAGGRMSEQVLATETTFSPNLNHFIS